MNTSQTAFEDLQAAYSSLQQIHAALDRAANRMWELPVDSPEWREADREFSEQQKRWDDASLQFKVASARFRQSIKDGA
jgi:hypothetical protein